MPCVNKGAIWRQQSVKFWWDVVTITQTPWFPLMTPWFYKGADKTLKWQVSVWWCHLDDVQSFKCLLACNTVFAKCSPVHHLSWYTASFLYLSFSPLKANHSKGSKQVSKLKLSLQIQNNQGPQSCWGKTPKNLSSIGRNCPWGPL